MIYLDHNAGAPLLPEVAELLRSSLGALGNPASVHTAGQAARARLEQARADVGKGLGCQAREIVFTAGGSEANALAMKGAFAARLQPRRNRIVASAIEHPSVIFCLEQLAAQGAQVQRVPPRADGAVDAQAMVDALGDDAFLCSLMWANNETGVLQPVASVAKACRERGVLFHTDAVQAAGKVPLADSQVPWDLLAISAHKLGGPPGVGALAVRQGVALQALVPGHQERARRGGTAAVVAAEALALALRIASEKDWKAVAARRDSLERALRAAVEGLSVNGGAPRIANTSNLRFDGVDAEALMVSLDLEGIATSTGAACASGSLEPSHVLIAMGLDRAQARSSLRLSLGAQTSADEIDTVTQAIDRAVRRIRTTQGK